MGGCAPKQFGPAIAYHAERTGVTDATARHTTVSSYYRFNAVLLSDLDDAIEQPDKRVQRQMAMAVLRGASALSQSAAANEIARMSVKSRIALAAVAGVDASVATLQAQFAAMASVALELDLQYVGQSATLTSAARRGHVADIDLLATPELVERLHAIRSGIEDLPDDRGRAQRRFLLALAASWTTKGIEREEAKLSEKSVAKAQKLFHRVAVWRPAKTMERTLIERYAPIIGMEWPTNRTYDAGSDRIGGVRLARDGKKIEVHIDSAKPTLYTYTTVAKIGGERLQQLNYVWWFSERPAMADKDPVAGHIDGAMIRITLDDNDDPLFVESSLNCGCGYVIFVSDAVELAARRAWGPRLPDKRFAVEKHAVGKRDMVVIDTFDADASPAHPLVLAAAGYHEVCQVRFQTPESYNMLDMVEDVSYDLVHYDMLDRLPLGDGMGSMFGPDGLVHNAGRREGFLLAPTGMLSAGQPRKRGTQRIRWDDYVHDDPHLLEDTLRIPRLD